LSGAEQKKFLESVLREKQKKGLKRISPNLRIKLNQISHSSAESSIHEVGLDEFRIIAEWYHYAILELTSCPGFQPTSKWIANALNISEVEAKLAVDRLLKLELLDAGDGTLRKTNFKSDTKDKSKTSLFHRKRQKQVLEKSVHSLEHDAIAVRKHSSLTLCLNPDRLAEAKLKIDQFMWEMSEFLMEEKQERVYEFQMSLFPLQGNNK
jgi:uncharacterized protein (TIGR02147 family)